MKSRGDVDAALEKAVDAADVAGVVAAAADANGVIYEGAFGKRGLKDPAAMTLDTVFWIASMTKAITGVAAMQLVEKRKIGLETAVGRIIPHLAQIKVIDGYDASGEPVLRAPKRPLTFRHLLTHTSGFSEDVWHADMRRYVEKTGMPLGSTGKLAAIQGPLICDPGERWEYGMSMDWVGQVIEKISGKTLDVYFRDHIYGPLGMKDSGYVLRPDQQARAAGVVYRKPDGSLEPFERKVPEKREYFPGGGQSYSTAPDYMNFLRMLLNGGEFNGARLLAPETVRLMAQNHIGAINVGPIRPAKLEISNNVEFFPGIVKKWGLSFLINTQDVAGRRKAGSLAWAGLGNTYYWLDPTSRIAGVLLTQVKPFADSTVLRLLDEYEAAIYA
jgi:CubicO group peptidase (beta-lactamase class C family)